MQLRRLFSSRSRKKVREHFKSLVAIAVSDSNLRKEEVDHLRFKAEKLGISEEEFNVLMEPGQEKSNFIPKNDTEKEKQLTEMIEVALVDGDFSEEEWEYFLRIGKRLGYSLGEIEDIARNSFNLSIPKIFYDRH